METRDRRNKREWEALSKIRETRKVRKKTEENRKYYSPQTEYV